MWKKETRRRRGEGKSSRLAVYSIFFSLLSFGRLFWKVCGKCFLRNGISQFNSPLPYIFTNGSLEKLTEIPTSFPLNRVNICSASPCFFPHKHVPQISSGHLWSQGSVMLEFSASICGMHSNKKHVWRYSSTMQLFWCNSAVDKLMVYVWELLVWNL